MRRLQALWENTAELQGLHRSASMGMAPCQIKQGQYLLFSARFLALRNQMPAILPFYAGHLGG